jgi:hypothetical protein
MFKNSSRIMKAETKTKSLEVYVKCNFKDSTHRAIEHGTGIGDDPIRKITLSLPKEGEEVYVKCNYKEATHIVHAYNDDDNGEQFHIKPITRPTVSEGEILRKAIEAEREENPYTDSKSVYVRGELRREYVHAYQVGFKAAINELKDRLLNTR